MGEGQSSSALARARVARPTGESEADVRAGYRLTPLVPNPVYPTDACLPARLQPVPNSNAHPGTGLQRGRVRAFLGEDFFSKPGKNGSDSLWDVN